MRNLKKRPVDYTLLTLMIGLLVFGYVMLVSASAPLGHERFGNVYWFAQHQLLFGLLPGIAAFLVTMHIPYLTWKRFAPYLFWVSIILLLLVFIPGVGSDFGTAKSWIVLGGFSFQPAEIVKLTFLLYLAAWFESRREKDLQDVNAGLIPFVVSLGLIMLLMVLQPDIGTMSVIVGMALTVYFVAGAPWPHLAALGGGGVVLFFLLIRLAPYRAARFMTFLHPELDPQGVGYHINQALLAIGSGGILGVGYGHSGQKFQYLPEVAGDSIFAVIAEELGFIVTAAFIGLVVAFLRRIVRVANAAPDKFGRFVAIGVAAWILFQSVLNIGAMLGLLPITGVPLPFVSYGGTSLVVTLAAMGIVLNISRFSKA